MPSATPTTVVAVRTRCAASSRRMNGKNSDRHRARCSGRVTATPPSLGDDAAVLHVDDAMRGVGDFAGVGREQDGDAGLAIELDQQLEDVRAVHRVEVAGGLVGNQQRRAVA